MVAPPLLDVHFFFSFNRFPLDHNACDDFQKLAHPSQTLYRQSPRMVQLITFVQTKTLIFPLDHFEVNQDWILIELFLYTIIQGRDATRASHTSHL